MTIKKIITIDMPNNRLHEKCELVPEKDFNSDWLKSLIQDLKDTADISKGSGVAAPQIGVNKQVIAYGGKPSKNFKGLEGVPFTILINPSYKPIGKQQVGLWEHCLSFPGRRGYTHRFQKIRYTGYSPKGERIDAQADGLLAILLQHEIDHVHGKLFPSLVHDPDKFGEIEKFEKTLGPNHHIEAGIVLLDKSQ